MAGVRRAHDPSRAGLGLRISSGLVLLFLYFPLGIIVLYAFTTQSSSFTFPPPGLTLEWFRVAFAREDMWQAFRLSLLVAGGERRRGDPARQPARRSPCYRSRFFGREALAFIIVLPIALPGIVTGIALRSTIGIVDFPTLGTWTIVLGHTTFCIVIVYNNVVARLRRMSPNVVEASADLGASGWQTFRYVIMPNLATALLAGGVLAFALSFDEIIVTTFTRGSDPTLPDLDLPGALPATEPARHERGRPDRGDRHDRAGAARATARPQFRRRSLGPGRGRGRWRVRGAAGPAEP